MRAWALIALGLLPVAGCTGASNSSCNSYSVTPPQITVTDATSGAAICDATVVATGPAGQSTLLANPADGGAECDYTGPAVAGSYTIQASKTGFQSATVSDVMVTKRTCAMSPLPPQTVSLRLTPSAP